MPLDMFQADRDEAVNYATRQSAPALPATFGDTFTAAWNEGMYFGQSVAGQNARKSAVSDLADEYFRRTGDDPERRMEAWGESQRYGSSVDYLNAKIAEQRQADPSFDMVPITDEEIERRAVAKGQQARSESAALGAREKTTGGTIGGYAGSAAIGAVDPVNVLTFPLAAPGGLGILRTALAWGGIAGGTQAGIEVLGAPFREQVQPGYGASGEPAANILGAAAFGGAIGGTIKTTSTLWSRLKTGDWPQSVRDAGHAVDSEANVGETNIFPGAEGETAHRAALTKAIDDVAAGRPADVDSIIPPELQNAYQARFTSIDEARQRAIETKAPEDVGDVAFELQGIAREAGYALPRQEADQIAARLVTVSDDQARAMLDEFLMRPRTLADTLPETSAGAAATGTRALTTALDRDRLAPAEVASMREDPGLAGAVTHDAELLLQKHGDVQFPSGETVDAAGNRAPAMRSLKEALAEANRKERAGDELLACLRPHGEV